MSDVEILSSRGTGFVVAATSFICEDSRDHRLMYASENRGAAGRKERRTAVRLVVRSPARSSPYALKRLAREDIRRIQVAVKPYRRTFPVRTETASSRISRTSAATPLKATAWNFLSSVPRQTPRIGSVGVGYAIGSDIVITFGHEKAPRPHRPGRSLDARVTAPPRGPCPSKSGFGRTSSARDIRG
jgi:hypothetical protein